ncbi:unnamed protein product [Ilex paraguariensis]|uniref:Protein SDA1 n=1 Tax=Ilex paraguariensis TaxID=185542 RepID=A0ABC8UHL2_9AQUA
MKIDPEGYQTELSLLYNQFKSSLELFQQQAALNFTSISGISTDSTVAKDLGDRAMFLSHMTPFYPEQLANFPTELADFLRSSGRSLPSGLRCHIAQALILLINRKVCPSLLIKKDRGRPIDPKARPKAFGEVNVASNVPDVELLQQNDGSDDDTNDHGYGSSSDDDNHNDEDVDAVEKDDNSIDDGWDGDHAFEYESDSSDDDDLQNDQNISAGCEDDDMQKVEVSEDEDANDWTDDEDDASDEDDDDEEEHGQINGSPTNCDKNEFKEKKRKFSDFDGQLNAANKSLRALKKLAGAKMNPGPSDTTDGILSNEDFQKIKELKAKKEARITLNQHGFKIPSSDNLSVKRVDAAKLEVNIRKKMSKDEKLALIRAGREERGKYQARTAVKQKKTGGLSNRQKEHKKAMPLAAKRAKVTRSRQEKKIKQQRSGKQFRGRKAWK